MSSGASYCTQIIKSNYTLHGRRESHVVITTLHPVLLYHGVKLVGENIGLAGIFFLAEFYFFFLQNDGCCLHYFASVLLTMKKFQNKFSQYWNGLVVVFLFVFFILSIDTFTNFSYVVFFSSMCRYFKFSALNRQNGIFVASQPNNYNRTLYVLYSQLGEVEPTKSEKYINFYPFVAFLHTNKCT